MSYYANGGGAIIPKTNIPEDKLELAKEAGFLVEDAPDGGLWFTFEYGSYNDQVEDVMEWIAPYVKSGDIEFTGEDAEHWRFHFKNGRVEEQNGEIKYKEKIDPAHVAAQLRDMIADHNNGTLCFTDEDAKYVGIAIELIENMKEEE